MENTKLRRPQKVRRAKEDSGSVTAQNPVALTVKIDRETYKRLVALRATGERLRTHQEILRRALEEYLDREGA